MAGNKKKRDTIPQNFKSLEAFDQFWSTHSLADYDDLQRDVDFKIRLSSAESVRLKPTVARRLKRHAKKRKLSIATLVNRLLDERLKESA